MSKILQRLRDQRGSSLVFGVVMAIFLLLLAIVIIQIIRTRATVAYIQTTAEQVLNVYTTTQGRNTEESFKNGGDYTVELDADRYIQQLQATLGIGEDNTGTTNGKTRFTLSDITLDYTVTNEIDSTVTMHVTMPLYWGDIPMTTIEGTITVRSKYESKE